MPFVVKVILTGVHDHCSRENSFDSSRCCEIALQFLYDSLCGIFFYCRDHQSKKLIPLVFWQFICSGNGQCLFTFVSNECRSQLFSVLVYILRKIERDHEPHIIRSYFYISMITVGWIKSIKKAIVEHSWFSSLACFLVS